MRAFALLCLLLLTALPAGAQQAPAVLVADRVFVDGAVLVAEGSVEILYDGSRLRAKAIRYDRRGDSLSIEGPIRLTDGQGGTVIVADAATLDRDLRNGILLGARMVLDEQLQLAAARLDRVNGRYTQLSRAVVTSCQVCEPGGTPLWQIRARRVVHDQEARQLYFDHAQFRIGAVPVFYLPRLRLPDPTLKRARGFLVPTARSTTDLGFGIKLPYFMPIGPHRDLTVTPYLSPVTRTVELRYRQAFARGDIQFDAAISRDTLRRDTWRGYLFGAGAFALNHGFRLTFDIEMTSDDGYLTQYGYSDKDRLDSSLILSRVRRDEYIALGLHHFESLKVGENNATQPTIVGDAIYERRLHPAMLGGELRMGAEMHSHFRYSDMAGVGRDVNRVNARLGWQRRWTLVGGLRLGAEGGMRFDAFNVNQGGPGVAAQAAQASTAAAVELRWPLVRRGADGSRDLVEPLAQIGWIGGTRLDIPNDESTRVEFDEGNLLSLSRFPAADRQERGTTLAYGVRWVHHAASGWRAGVTLGQVLRSDADPDFTVSSGLGGTRSDLLLAAQFHNGRGLAFWARGLIGRNGDVSKAEARLDWQNRRVGLGASYLLLAADTEEDRPASISEWSLDTRYRIGRHWTATGEWRYDLASDRAARAGLGLEYRNECVEVDFSVTRRFTSTTVLNDSTNFGLTVALKGFSTGGSAKEFRRSCSQ